MNALKKLLTGTAAAAASADFSMSIPDGYVAELTNDGGVQLRNQSARIVIPFISAPWALDSNGKKLPTSYTVNGSKITQHVNTSGAAYPIVADPSIQWIPYRSSPCTAGRLTPSATSETSGSPAQGFSCGLLRIQDLESWSRGHTHASPRLRITHEEKHACLPVHL